MQRLASAAVLTAMLSLSACGNDPGTCAPRVAILDPVDGQAIGPADDADPSTPMIEYEFVIDTCGLEELEQVELVLTVPVSSPWGYGLPDETGIARIQAPLQIPGDHTFYVQGVETAVQSPEITISVSP